MLPGLFLVSGAAAFRTKRLGFYALRAGITYASEAAVDFADQSMEAVSYYAILASTELAAERGAYPSFPGSKWDRGLLPIDTVPLLAEERGEPVTVSLGSTTHS